MTTGTATLDTAAIQEALDAAIAPDVVGALIRIGGPEGTWTATAGNSTLDRQRPVDPSGTFRAASITKTFVATVVLQLVAEGWIGLDEPVQHHLPSTLPASYPPITVRQLLQHTSGLPNYYPHLVRAPAQIVRDRCQHWPAEKLLAISTAHPLDFEPGTELGYSDTNYVLLGILIRRGVTGRWWGTEVDRRIAGPLGLGSTYAPGNDLMLPTPHARGYLVITGPDGRRYPMDITEMNTSAADAAGSMISSAEDLDVFYAALLAGELVPASLLEEMLTPSEKGTLIGSPWTWAGWGLGIQTLRLPESCGGRMVYGTSAGIAGYTGAAFSTRDGQRRVVIFFNTASDDPTSTRHVQKLIEITRVAFCGHQE